MLRYLSCLLLALSACFSLPAGTDHADGGEGARGTQGATSTDGSADAGSGSSAANAGGDAGSGSSAANAGGDAGSGSSAANAGSASGDDAGSACLPCTLGVGCDGGCSAPTWNPVANRTLSFFVTVASQCSDGGYDIADAGEPVVDEQLASPGPTAVAPVECPPAVPGDCSSATVCSVDPSIMPVPPTFAGMFQAVGPDPDITSPTNVGNGVAATFSVAAAGIPATVGFVARRSSSTSGPTGPADLLVDIVPTVDGVPAQNTPYIARARYNVGNLPFDGFTPTDMRVTLTFETNSTSVLQPNQTYALYFHIEYPGIDHVGLAGTEVTTNSNIVMYEREFLAGE